MTYRQIIGSVMESLKKSGDDTDITPYHVAYWVQMFVNEVRAAYLEENEYTGGFLSTFDSVPVQVDSKNRKYIDLPARVITLENEAGIDYITYDFKNNCCCGGDPLNYQQFSKTKPSELRSLYGDEYTKPKPDNPYFYPKGEKHNGLSINRAYLVGIECVDVKNVEVGLYCRLDPTDVCDLNDEIPIPDQYTPEVFQSVLNMGRFMMMVPEERVNEGEDLAGESFPSQIRKAPESQNQ